MQVAAGLSLMLGRVLLAWCEQLGDPSLARYQETGGFTGLSRATSLDLVKVLAELRASGLRDESGEGEPVYLKWQRFARRHQPGRLVVDAVEADPRSQAAGTLLTRNPFGLVEGILIAAAAHQVSQVRLLLPEHLDQYQAVLLNSFEQAADANLAPPVELELVRSSRISVWRQGPLEPDSDGPALVHHLQTWYRIALVMAMGAAWMASTGAGEQSGTRLLTMGGSVERPGLVEAPLGVKLWEIVEAMAGGLSGDEPLAMVIDRGLGGFLPPSEAQVPLAPEELAEAGVNPSLRTIWLRPVASCMVDRTRRALAQYWHLSGQGPSEERNLIARALRLVTEITVNKGTKGHVEELKILSSRMAALGLAAAWPLGSSLSYFPDQWQQHADRLSCPAEVCLKRRPAPCHGTCPANIDIPSFLALIGQGRYGEATATISQDNPLPYVCGLVCPAPCEEVCLRGEMDGAICIRAMKAVAASHALDEGGYPLPDLAPGSGKRVAIVGSGPAGLTAAKFLAVMGHKPVIFEAQSEPGGMLRYGIPAYRLPRETLEAEVAQIQRLGVEIKTDYMVHNLAELKEMDFDAYFLAVGTQVSRLVPVEGVDLPIVVGGLDFLKEVRGGQEPEVGNRVLVVGGGNVAIDVALTALREGAHRVDLVCLESRRQMPAHVSEVEMAIHEGVEVHNSWGPVRFSPDGSGLFNRCTRVFDERGRFSPQFDPEVTTTFTVDQVILAIGQATDLACVEQGSEVEVERGLICADQGSLHTREPGVFAGGDAVYGPRTVVEAVGAGKRAALSMDAFLGGREQEEIKVEPVRRQEVTPLRVDPETRSSLRRPVIPTMDIKDREGNYQQVELGLTDEMALGEASRCLRCDLCIGCGLCQLVCSEIGAEALRLKETKADRLAFNDFTRPQARCIGCGACHNACPTGAIKVVDSQGVRQTVLTGTVVQEHELVTCRVCGGHYAPQAFFDHLKKRVGPAAVPHVDRNICPSCARFRRAQELAGTPFYRPQ